MAGESPDRSKQHESSTASGEPTSGSPAAVPSPAVSVERDPRLAMSREKVRVDQATAVFSTRALRVGSAGGGDAEGSADEGPAEPTPPSDPPEGSSERSSGPGGKGDERLREAVAAWVRSADVPEAEEAEGADVPEGADAGAGTSGAAEEPEGADADADAGSDDSGAGEASVEGADAEPSADGDGDSEPSADAEADGDSESSTDAGADTESSTGADDEAEPDADAKSASEAEDSDPEPDADGVDGSDGDAEPSTGTEGDSKPTGGTGGTGSDDEPTGGAKADAGAKASAASDAVEAPATPSKDAEEPAAAKGATADAKPPVDQPTAIFKAPRSSAVDQPTTMLKLGDTKPGERSAEAKPATKPDAKSDSKATPTPQAPAERTSKFVALKPLDEPAPAKSRPAPAVAPAEATAAIPQVGPERTTQQPLPPRPPLDLLAELTNTPPPRETPVRTIVRRVKIWTPIAILLAIVFAVVQVVRPLPAAGLALTADETYTFEGGTLDLPWPGQGQSAIEVEGVGSLGTEGRQTPKPIASVAKIMTAYVILQEHPLKGNAGGPEITVDQKAEDESKNEDESTAAMTKGQKFTERQMLQMLMIPSGNNAARLLARWDSDSKTFVGKMNAAAKKLGMTKSTYTDPSGLEKTTVSTAADQVKLAKQVMQNDVFRVIVGMAKADIPGLKGTIYNNNDLLVKQVGVIGLKTGSSTPAGGNLVWAATKTVNGKTQTIYGAVLNQDGGSGRVWDSLQLAITNSQKLIDRIQQSLTSAMVVKKGQVVGYVDDQLGGRTPVVATKNMTAVGWPGLKTKISLGAKDGETIPHEAKTGEVVGELTVGDGSSHAVQIPVVLRSDLTEPGYGAKLTRLS